MNSTLLNIITGLFIALVLFALVIVIWRLAVKIQAFNYLVRYTGLDKYKINCNDPDKAEKMRRDYISEFIIAKADVIAMRGIGLIDNLARITITMQKARASLCHLQKNCNRIVDPNFLFDKSLSIEINPKNSAAVKEVEEFLGDWAEFIMALRAYDVYIHGFLIFKNQPVPVLER